MVVEGSYTRQQNLRKYTVWKGKCSSLQLKDGVGGRFNVWSLRNRALGETYGWLLPVAMSSVTSYRVRLVH